MGDNESVPLPSKDDFALAYIQNQGRVYAYIATLVPNRSDAEDILQRTSLVMWQKWDQFDSRFGFVAWARGIALNEVRNFLRRSERKNVHLSEAMVVAIAQEMEDQTDTQRVEALERCLDSLEHRQRELLEKCYLESVGAKEFAASLGISADAIYMRLHRVRKALVQCIEREVSRGIAESGGAS